jgi:hypothetical protein
VIYAFFCELEAFDPTNVPETVFDDDTKRFAIMSVIVFIICILVMNYMHISVEEISNQDFEDFKKLLQEHNVK